MLEQLRQFQNSGKPDAKFWSSHYSHANREKLIENLKKDQIIIFLRENTKGRFLEAGCGSAQYSYDLSRHGIDTYGIDYSEEAIRSSHCSFPEIKRNITKGDLFDLKFKKGFFDTYYSPGVIEHYVCNKDRQLILKEAFRVLKPGGTFLITVPYANPVRRIWWIIQGRINEHLIGRGYSFYQYLYKPEELCNELKAAGFEVVRTSYLNPDYLAKILQKMMQGSFINHLPITRFLLGHMLCAVAKKPALKSDSL